MRHFLLVFAIFTGFLSYSQKDSIEQNKYRFFMDGNPFFALSTRSNNPSSVSFGAGATFRAGNNWFFKTKRHYGVFRLTWLRIGLHGGDGSGFILAPANVGIGPRFLINDKVSIEPMISGGLLMITDDVIAPTLEFSYLVLPELKINVNSFTIGAEYSFRAEKSSSGMTRGYLHYVGFSIGGRLKKID